jgi:hypothetical protein
MGVRIIVKAFASACLATAIFTVIALSFPTRRLFASSSHSYYVDPAGRDSNDGLSPKRAWRTVARVNSTSLQPGDAVYFKADGLWRETLEPIRGGAPGMPITFSHYGSGPRPIISGSDVVGGWSEGIRGTYSAPLREKPNNVFVDGGPGWGLTHACCAPGSACLAIAPCAIGPMTAGSWYWNAGAQRLRVWLPDGSSPASHSIEAATRLYGMKVIADGGEKSYLTVDGLTFERTGGYGLYFYTNAERGNGANGIVVRNCTVTQTGTGQVDDGSYYNGIHYSQAKELPTAPVFEGNTISYTGNHGNGINSQAADRAILLNNDVTHFNHHGLDTKHSRAVIIEGNRVHDSGVSNGIYQEYSDDALIEGNVVYRIVGATVPGRGSGIQIDTQSDGAKILNNSIYDVLTGIYLKRPALVKNNVVADATHAVVEAKRGGFFSDNVWGEPAIIFIGDRRYDGASWTASGHNDVIADPMFADPADGNLRPLPSSPCIARRAGATYAGR